MGISRETLDVNFTAAMVHSDVAVSVFGATVSILSDFLTERTNTETSQL
jgi:hypothetical protein